MTSLIAFEKGMMLRYVSGYNHLPKCYFLLAGKLKAQQKKNKKHPKPTLPAISSLPPPIYLNHLIVGENILPTTSFCNCYILLLLINMHGE